MLLRVLLCMPGSPLQEVLKDALGDSVLAKRAGDERALWSAVRSDEFDLAILGTAALGEDPLRSLRTLMSLSDGPGVVVIADGDASESSAYLAAGCLAVLDSELVEEDLVAALQAVVVRATRDRDRHAVPGARIERRLDAMGTRSPAIRRFQDVTRKVAVGDSPVLIQGEPGTGKTWLGPVIHRESPRARGPFQSLRCSGAQEESLEITLFGHTADALPGATAAHRGILERAHGGTLFLERIDSAPLGFQDKLLHYLDAGSCQRVGGSTSIHVDVRLLASVKDEPEAQVEAGHLHPDLYRRIGLTNLTPPPLRERPEDIPDLARAAHHKWCERYGLAVDGFTSSAMDALQQHRWPGNVSELWSVVERSTLLSRGDRIGVEDLPPDMVARLDKRAGVGFLVLDAPWLQDPAQLPTLRDLRAQSLEVVERAYLVELLRAAGGRVAEAARRAEVDPRSLYDRMRRYGLRKEDFKPPRRPLRGRSEDS